jgi:hypothetical protein
MRSAHNEDLIEVQSPRRARYETPPTGGWSDAAHRSLFAQVRPEHAQREIADWLCYGNCLSETARKKQHDDDDQDDANETIAAVTIAVAWTAETATEATKQEDDEDYDEDGSERHDESPFAAISEC